MSECLVLIGGDSPSAPLAWVRVSERGAVVEEGFTDDRAPPSAAPARTVLVLPAADARLRRLELPARSEAQARAGAEMLFGGSLAGGEAMHYAVGAAQDGAGARLVAAIATARLTQWLERCRSLGADPHTVVLDCTLWPVNGNDVVIAVADNRTIVAGGRFGGFSIEPDLAPALAARWLSEAGPSGARITVQGEGAEHYRSALAREVVSQPLPDPIATLARSALEIPAFAPNLRQGAFAPANAEGRPFELWRFAALLLVAAVMLQIGSLIIAGWRDARAASQIMETAERDFRAARPDVRRVVNLRAQVAALVNAAEQAVRHPVIVTSEPLIQALRAQPLARIDEVRHEGPARDVRLIVSAPQAQSLGDFAAALRESGLEVQARDLAPREGRFTAEITVTAP